MKTNPVVFFSSRHFGLLLSGCWLMIYSLPFIIIATSSHIPIIAATRYPMTPIFLMLNI
jgi:hypothetical protein